MTVCEWVGQSVHVLKLAETQKWRTDLLERTYAAVMESFCVARQRPVRRFAVVARV